MLWRRLQKTAGWSPSGTFPPRKLNQEIGQRLAVSGDFDGCFRTVGDAWGELHLAEVTLLASLFVLAVGSERARSVTVVECA